MHTNLLTCLLCTALVAAGWSHAADTMNISSTPWGQTSAGQPVTLFTLTSGKVECKITNYGGIIVSLSVPDRNGKVADVVLGKDSLADYEAGHPFFGALTGRYANRIAGGAFKLDGVEYKINKRGKAEHALHGGVEGFDKKVWSAETQTRENEIGVILRHTSPDGDEGFPGELTCTVSYWLTSDATLRIDYSAITNKPTVVNLTNHSYFNLAGQGNGSIVDHEMQISADRYTPTDSNLIPTGEVAALAGTPLDFSSPQRIGNRIDADFEALKFGGGYDHNYVLKANEPGLKDCAKVRDPSSGRVMTVRTTCPAVQLYTANHMKDVAGKAGTVYPFRGGFCLETQHFPDSPNQPNFPSTVLRPGEKYEQITTFHFTAE